MATKLQFDDLMIDKRDEARWITVHGEIERWNVMGVSEGKANPGRRWRYTAFWPAGMDGQEIVTGRIVPRETTS